MLTTMIAVPENLFKNIGLKWRENLHYQLSPEELTAQAIERGEGVLNNTVTLVIRTGEFTGRSPKDKFIVEDNITATTVNWNEFNIPIEDKYFDLLYRKMIDYLDEK